MKFSSKRGIIMPIQKNKISLAVAAATIQSTLKPFVNQDVCIAKSSEFESSIYFSDNRFPLDLINNGTPGSDQREGEPSILSQISKIEEQGIKIAIKPRQENDETGYQNGMPQDFKIVVTAPA
tara:strand:+ start:2541 stop:2909 length:369 start_codon:yes stop_codon:yes gene_type:complete